MGKVYRNHKDIAVPSFGYTDRHDGRVYVIINDSDGKTHRKIIGHMTDSTLGNERMVPNDYFKSIYQDLWTEAYPTETIPNHEMSIGLYVLTLGISEKIGLYTILQDVYGMVNVNSILDYAMFLIHSRCCTSQVFDKCMEREVLFSDKLHGDSFYSRLFSSILAEDQHHLLKIRWVNNLVKAGLKKVWLAIDGSNNDCEARQSFLARYGFPKSHNKNKTIVGYMYAVDSETGIPVTYYVYEGCVPDNKAFQWMATFLSGFDIEIEGVILDRGFAVEEVFKKIDEEKWKYVIMLPTDTNAHKKMYEMYSEVIRWKSEYVLNDEAVFGISDTMQLFKIHERTSNICLYFDGGSGSWQSIRLIKKIQASKKKAENAIRNGKKAGIESSLRKYLTIEGEGPERKVVANYAAWDSSMAAKGYFSLAVSAGISPDRASKIYKRRDTSETQFSIMKSQEGGDVTRVHKTEGIYSKFALVFISSILRFYIEKSCKELDLDTNPMIQGLEQVTILYTAEDKYQAVRRLNSDQEELFNVFDINYDIIEKVARDFNDRNRTDSRNPERRLPLNQAPVTRTNSHKRGRPPKQADNLNPPKQELQGEDKSIPIEKSKGGRPKGRKDTKPRKPRNDKGKKRDRYIRQEKNML